MDYIQVNSFVGMTDAQIETLARMVAPEMYPFVFFFVHALFFFLFMRYFFYDPSTETNENDLTVTSTSGIFSKVKNWCPPPLTPQKKATLIFLTKKDLL